MKMFLMLQLVESQMGQVFHFDTSVFFHPSSPCQNLSISLPTFHSCAILAHECKAREEAISDQRSALSETYQLGSQDA